jgi:hypothetical protein
MATGLFNSREGRGGPRRGYVPINRRTPRSTVAAFAEAMANGADTIRAASRVAGVSEKQGSNIFRQMRAELGWQAA